MEKITTYILRIVSIVLILSVWACSDDTEEKNDFSGRVPDEEIPINVDLDTKDLPNGLKCDLYIFWKTTGGVNDYIYKEKVEITSSPVNKRFENYELENKSYRFFFLATNASVPEIEIKNSTSGNNQLAANVTEWNDINVRAISQILSTENYYQVLDMTGDEISTTGRINSILKHMVGQMVLDIFKINGNINTSIDIDKTNLIASVLDRVYEINIKYEGATNELTFDSNKELVPLTYWTSITNEDKIEPAYLNDSLKVVLPQTQKGLLESSTGKFGAVRIMSGSFLPSDKKMKVTYTFRYYDTTPACGDINHTHIKDCYDKRSLVLNLPEKTGTPTLLSVYPNHYTLNKAGIRFNRIIDLDQATSFELLTTWSNQN